MISGFIRKSSLPPLAKRGEGRVKVLGYILVINLQKKEIS